MERKEELNKQIEALNNVLNPLLEESREIESNEQREINKKLIGKCFKYENSYGFGDKWWLYTYIIGVSESSDTLTVLTVQDDKGGVVEIKKETRMASSYYKGNSEIPITFKEFKKQFDKTLKKLSYT